MPNILAFGNITMPTSAAMLVTGADIFTPEGVRQSTPTSASIITTPPTFAGIISAIPDLNGAFLITWPAATGPNAPIDFQIYAALGVVLPADLFVPANLVSIGPPLSTQKRIWTLGDQLTYFIRGLTYTFGVRAKDGVQNQNINLTVVSAAATASGNIIAELQALSVALQITETSLDADHAAFVAVAADLESTASDITSAAAATQNLLTNLTEITGVLDPQSSFELAGVVE